LLGFVNLFKPAGPTSTQFGARLRGIYGSREHKLAVGHLGTLDPQAAGVLPIALGRATRLLPLIEDRRKRYACTLVFGTQTDTGDATGKVIATAPVPDDLDARLAAALRAFVGVVEQTPPMFSAVHHEGKRLYELARAGTVVAGEAEHNDLRPVRPIALGSGRAAAPRLQRGDVRTRAV
jgi:tRNA pseudouridine55 synthase